MSMRQTWILAVSGGVDSMVMLDMLMQANERRYIVAHVDHGIRNDSAEDRELVKKLAKKWDLGFECVELRLGSSVSEDKARSMRHAWLEEIRRKYGAEAIATAHHQDDVLETIAINLIRGTGWRGLCSLRETKILKRPLLGKSKAEIVSYAIENDLKWREDITNDQFNFMRNELRVRLAGLEPDHRKRLLDLYTEQLGLREEVEHISSRLILDGLDRYLLTMSSDSVAYELLRAWLGTGYQKHQMLRLLHFAKTARPNKKFSLNYDQFVVAKASELVVSTRED